LPRDMPPPLSIRTVARVAAYSDALHSAAVEAEARRVNNTFATYKSEEEPIRRAAEKQRARLQRKLSKTLSDGLSLVSPDAVLSDEALAVEHLEQIEILEREHAPDYEVLAIKRKYIDVIERLRRTRAPHLYGNGGATSTVESHEPLTPTCDDDAAPREAPLTTAERFAAAEKAAVAAAETQRIDRKCQMYRLEEAAISAAHAKMLAKAEARAKRLMYMDGVKCVKAGAVALAEHAVEAIEAELKEAELDHELAALGTPRREPPTPEETQPIKLRYIAAVEELRRRRAPHLYGGRTPTATPCDSPCDTPPSSVGTLLTARGAAVETEGATSEEAEAATRLQARYRGQRDRAQNGGAGAAAANEEEDGELAVVDFEDDDVQAHGD